MLITGFSNQFKMCKLLFTLVVCVIALNDVLGRSASSPLEEWDIFREKFSKSYHTRVEEESRMKIFYKNLESIKQHNKLYEEGKVSFKRIVNKFTDKEYKELIKEKCGLVSSRQQRDKSRRVKKLDDSMVRGNASDDLPDAIDWREKGAVTPVKDQRHCGSCWAFSASGALEGQLFLKTGNLIGLSEQNLVDCAWLQGNQGCGGGDMPWAFEYVMDNYGISKEQYYPYEGRNNICRYFFLFRGTGCDSYVELPRGDEDELKSVVATIGPVAVSFNVEDDFFDYSEGIYYKENCDPDYLNHGMLAVGYGTTESGEDYWIIKNSWGEDWGEKGYVKVARNRSNVCGIGSENSYPVI